MQTSLFIAMAQLEFLVGDFTYNSNKILSYYAKALAENADLIIFPELALTGYNIKDMAKLLSFQIKAAEAIENIALITKGKSCAMLVGSIHVQNDRVYNAAFFLKNGIIDEIICKTELPNQGIFTEKRIFDKGLSNRLLNLDKIKLGVAICEDVWKGNTISNLNAQGAELFISINASPFVVNKLPLRIKVISQHCQDYAKPFIYLNTVGGQDELLFDGSSFIMEEQVVKLLAGFEEDFQIMRFNKINHHWRYAGPPETITMMSKPEQIYLAAIFSIKSYFNQNNFTGVILGLSGGIDSSITAVMAVDALGRDKVRVVMMPSKYTSTSSMDDAIHLSNKLAIHLDIIPINESVNALESSLSDVFQNTTPDLTEENLQARIRGVVLMAISNKFNLLVLATGNKSENAVGYSTLYGDMVGGFNPITDIYKTDIYKIARWRNSQNNPKLLATGGNLINESILDKAPTAELRPNQTDQDSLPDYDLLDKILFELIEHNTSIEQLISYGYDKKTVEQIQKLLYRAEYKRRQSAPGPKISSKHLSADRHYPINNKYL